ncbi:SANT/Myb domain [Dillenia turbinata]|uniref:SANT/Myb domain n=1 Tax=Dillenia turbinata TaxID=194707 RepID=A0AAN8ZN08_9MAGN
METNLSIYNCKYISPSFLGDETNPHQGFSTLLLINPSFMLQKRPWTKEEEQILVTAQAASGNSWVKIAQRMPGRTEDNVKNHWHSTQRRNGPGRY